jgi:anaerobic ribonucleoside-triphosphate reductase activating protein
MKINKIIKDSQVNGPGKRYTIWVQGCQINCKGCCNKDTWDINKGEYWTPKALFEDIQKCKIDGITLTGGEPLEQYQEILEFLQLVFPTYNIFLTSGYTFETIKLCKTEVLKYIDILVSGPFIEELLDESGKWRGSTNQVIHFLTERSKQFENYKPEYRTEIKIDKKTNEIIVNGFVISKNIKQFLKGGLNVK